MVRTLPKRRDAAFQDYALACNHYAKARVLPYMSEHTPQSAMSPGTTRRRPRLPGSHELEEFIEPNKALEPKLGTAAPATSKLTVAKRRARSGI